MSQPTVYYFNVRARAELIRFVLTFAGVQFKDVRVDGPIDDVLRARLTFGQLPFYEDDQVQLAQSNSIVRYLADKYKLDGDNAIERANADVINESANDVLNGFWTSRNDEAKLAKYKSETVPKFLTKWEALLLKNGGKHFVGKSYTYADLAVFNGLDYLKLLDIDQLDNAKHPTLYSFYKTVSEIPSIAKYIAERPVNRM